MSSYDNITWRCAMEYGQTYKQLAQKAAMLEAWESKQDLSPYGAVEEIAAEFGLRADTVRRSLYRYGVLQPSEIPSKSAVDREYEIAEVQFLLSLGRSVAEIAQTLGLTAEGLIGRVVYWRNHGHADIDLGVPRWDLQDERWTREAEFQSRKMQKQQDFKHMFQDRVA
jgi:transposase-like protein